MEEKMGDLDTQFRNLILAENVKEFNALKAQHPRCWLNLRGIDLSHKKLSEINLERADLTDAMLVFTDLSHSKLNLADLSSTNVTNANFIGADMSEELQRLLKAMGHPWR